MENGEQDFNVVNLCTRLGMGQCQGCYCTSKAAILLAAKIGKPVSQIGTPSVRLQHIQFVWKTSMFWRKSLNQTIGRQPWKSCD